MIIIDISYIANILTKIIVNGTTRLIEGIRIGTNIIPRLFIKDEDIGIAIIIISNEISP
jgi:hypothetical protein